MHLSKRFKQRGHTVQLFLQLTVLLESVADKLLRPRVCIGLVFALDQILERPLPVALIRGVRSFVIGGGDLAMRLFLRLHAILDVCQRIYALLPALPGVGSRNARCISYPGCCAAIAACCACCAALSEKLEIKIESYHVDFSSLPVSGRSFGQSVQKWRGAV